MVEERAAVRTSGGASGHDGLGTAASVESLLFVADAPVSIARLAEALEVRASDIEKALAELEHWYEGRGLSLQRVGSQVQFITAPQAARHIERFLGLGSRARLSRAALETLAIICYRQPITRPELESIRGVNSDSVIRTLVSTGLIEEIGRAMTVGRAILYGTTFEFLRQFGLRSLEELPPLEELALVEGEGP